MKLSLSLILKIAGYFVGAIGAVIIIFAEFNVLLEHPIALVLLAMGAAAWFAGVWEARHEAQLAAATPKPAAPATPVPAPTV